MPRLSVMCDTTTQTFSLIISKTNRTVKRHIITCNQLCDVIQPTAIQTMPQSTAEAQYCNTSAIGNLWLSVISTQQHELSH